MRQCIDGLRFRLTRNVFFRPSLSNARQPSAKLEVQRSTFNRGFRGTFHIQGSLVKIHLTLSGFAFPGLFKYTS
jgi:hypothetical protein